MRTSLILLASIVLLAACSNDAETTAPQSTVPSTLNGFSQGTKLDLPPGPGVLARGQKSDSVFAVFSPVAQFDGVISSGAAAGASCPSGSIRVGGGFRIQNGWDVIRIVQSEPHSANGWYVVGMGTNGTPGSFYAIATCLQQ